jgi:hypothetical protein
MLCPSWSCPLSFSHLQHVVLLLKLPLKLLTSSACCVRLEAAPEASHFFSMLCPSRCCPLSFSFPFLYICTISSNPTHILGFVNQLPEKLLFYCLYWHQRLLISVFRVRLNGFSMYHALCIPLSGLSWRLWCCFIISIINYDLGKSFNHILWFMYALAQRTKTYSIQS